MRKLRTNLILGALVVGAVALTYQIMLTPEAKKALKGAIDALKNGYEAIMDSYGDNQGSPMTEEVLPNRESTISQWESIGY